MIDIINDPNLIKEGDLIKVFILENGSFQLYPEVIDVPTILVNKGQLFELLNDELTFSSDNTKLIINMKKRCRDIEEELAKNDWKQLRAYRRWMLTGQLSDDDKKTLEWFNDKAAELEEYRNYKGE